MRAKVVDKNDLIGSLKTENTDEKSIEKTNNNVEITVEKLINSYVESISEKTTVENNEIPSDPK
jgi:hypothetical protein